ERLPAAARTAGQWVGQARRILREAKSDLERELREHENSDLGALKRGLEEAGAELKSAGETFHEVGAGMVDAHGTDALRQTFQQASPLAAVKKTAAKKKPSKKKPAVSKKRIAKKPAAKKISAKKKVAKKTAKKKPVAKKQSKKRIVKKAQAARAQKTRRA
ncbi:MAG: hypothetical protein OD918_03620, partial [Gammaproteobacteria bacterium]